MRPSRKWYEDDDLAVGPHACPECGGDCYCSFLDPDECVHDCDAEAREREEDRRRDIKVWDED